MSLKLTDMNKLYKCKIRLLLLLAKTLWEELRPSGFENGNRDFDSEVTKRVVQNNSSGILNWVHVKNWMIFRKICD
jgi:hypothetical protein